MQTILDALIDAGIDTLKLIPFLFLTYLLMEFIENKTSKKTQKAIQKSGKFGPILGGIIGMFPQCGFSTMGANLYAARIITLGTLFSIFLSTSDEMLPILISEQRNVKEILIILGIKVAIAVITGLIIDLIIRIYRKAKKKKQFEEEKIEEICDKENCHCEEDGIFKSALKHTLNIIIYIFLITLAINILVGFIGEDSIKNLVLNKPIIGPMISSLIGLIPNCAGSVILTDFYLSGVINLGTMIGGLLTNCGIGMLVLFKVNKNKKENLKILGLAYLIGVIWGIVLSILPITI